MRGKIVIDTAYCKGCRLCIEFCPKGIIQVSSRLNAKGYHFAQCTAQKDCTGCATCALVCPETAIEVYRE